MTVFASRRSRTLSNILVAGAVTLICSPGSAAQPSSTRAGTPRPDLATQVEGGYFGNVISDARGSSRSDVRINVTRIGPNKIRVTSDYPRLRPFEAVLSRYLETIQNVGGNEVFLFDGSKRPASLDITVDDASWSGARD